MKSVSFVSVCFVYNWHLIETFGTLSLSCFRFPCRLFFRLETLITYPVCPPFMSSVKITWRLGGGSKHSFAVRVLPKPPFVLGPCFLLSVKFLSRDSFC